MNSEPGEDVLHVTPGRIETYLQLRCDLTCRHARAEMAEHLRFAGSESVTRGKTRIRARERFATLDDREKAIRWAVGDAFEQGDMNGVTANSRANLGRLPF